MLGIVFDSFYIYVTVRLGVSLVWEASTLLSVGRTLVIPDQALFRLWWRSLSAISA